MKHMKIAFIALLLLVTLAACETRVVTTGPEQQHTLNVQGTSEFDVSPDIAKIRFRVETQSLNAQEAQAQNRQIANSVHSALLQAGVRENELETTDFRLDKVQEWDQKEQRMVDKGYRASNAFVVTTKDLEAVGKLLDTGVQAGANNVESLSFELSDTRSKEVKTEALRKAATNAKEKAQALADGAGVSLGKVASITENSYVVMPYARYDLQSMKAEAGAAPSPISPENVHINAQVSVAYELA
ncbi:SIMPL domain-containing protein [Candidatus Woesearchaeota archaeon]|nr:SIMPL domain-containing protein [Candidatus Woesearchaeota archaeon]